MHLRERGEGGSRAGRERGRRGRGGQGEAGERKPWRCRRGRGGGKDPNCPLQPSSPFCIYRALSPNNAVLPRGGEHTSHGQDFLCLSCSLRERAPH